MRGAGDFLVVDDKAARRPGLISRCKQTGWVDIVADAEFRKGLRCNLPAKAIRGRDLFDVADKIFRLVVGLWIDVEIECDGKLAAATQAADKRRTGWEHKNRIDRPGSNWRCSG